MNQATEKIGKAILPAIEYMADNAYVAPGFHRLFTAGGLFAGLWSGRQVMDVVTAHRQSDHSTVQRKDVFWAMRPLHGRMRYNFYSDAPEDRWKEVFDKTIPTLFGAAGAYAGSRYFAHGHDFSNQPFHAISENARKAFGEVKDFSANHSLQSITSRFAGHHSDALRPYASLAFGAGSGSGFQVLGALLPGSNAASAMLFQMLHERQINLPFVHWINRHVFGNRAYGTSDSLRPYMQKAARWAEVNILKHDTLDWLTDQHLDDLTRNALQNFRDLTPEIEGKVRASLKSLMEEAFAHKQQNTSKTEAELSKEIYQKIIGQGVKAGADNGHGFMGAAFDNLLHQSGVDLAQADIAGHNMFTFLARLFGSTANEQKVEKAWAAHIKQHYNADYGDVSRVVIPAWQKATAWGGGAAAVGGMGYAISSSGQRINQRINHADDDTKGKADAQTPWYNGKLLDAAEWVGRTAITPPSSHRLTCAASLSLGLMGGMYLADTLAGRKLKGIFAQHSTSSLLDAKDVWKPLQALHGKLAYTPGSVEIADRFRQSAHYLLPVVTGGLGTLTGSTLFFYNRAQKLHEPQTLEEYTDKISLVQAKPFGVLTAVTSIFNTGSGLHMLPFVNYSNNLQNRYLMASGQQVAMPVVGHWWSGNAGLTPMGIKRTLEYTVDYLTYNDAARTRELPALLHAVVAKLYPALPDEALLKHKQVMLDSIYAERDRYVRDGKIPKNYQKSLHRAMKAMLSGDGFEQLLERAGLDPAAADLAANGVSGKIANALGSKHRVHDLETHYREDYQTRKEHRQMQEKQLRTVAVNEPSAAPVPGNTLQAWQLESRLQPEMARGRTEAG